MRFFSNNSIDDTNGSITGKIISFTLPLILTGLFQCAFNSADLIVVGQFTGSKALAAIGSTTAFLELLINFFVGLSTGTAVALSHAIGAGNDKDASEYSHSSILLSVIIGVIIAIFSIVFSRKLLIAMGTPKSVLEDAILYFRIYISGAPIILLYNFSSSIMRTTGDTLRPLLFLLIAGIINVILNLILVIVFNLGCAGVAVATVVSNLISAVLTVYSLTKKANCCRITFSNLRICPKKILKIILYGVPIGITTSFSSFSNVLYQKAINSFGAAAVAGHVAASNIEGLVEPFSNEFGTAMLTFSGRNYGAKKADRIKEICIKTHIIAFVFVFSAVAFIYLTRKQLIGLFITDSQSAFDYALLKIKYVVLPYSICMIQTIGTGFLRGVGKSILPMIYSVFFVCIMRLIWLYAIFPIWHTMECIYFSYPLTWALTVVVLVISEVITIKQLRKKFSLKITEQSE